jgi:hypothetical protein
MSREAKYRLTVRAPGALEADTSSGGDFQTLAGALTVAWANDSSGGRSLGITCGGMPVMGEEDLRRAFGLLRAAEGECHGGNLIACAGHVLKEMGLE